MVVYSVTVSVSGLVNDNGNYESQFPSFGNAIKKSFVMTSQCETCGSYYWKLLIYTASDWYIPIVKTRDQTQLELRFHHLWLRRLLKAEHTTCQFMSSRSIVYFSSAYSNSKTVESRRKPLHRNWRLTLLKIELDSTKASSQPELKIDLVPYNHAGCLWIRQQLCTSTEPFSFSELKKSGSQSL